MTMERHVDHELEEVRQTVMQMGGLVERMIGDSMRSIVDRDDELAAAVIESDVEVDGIEKTLDEEIVRLLATKQPAATDLRFLIAVMKVANDLERIGDSTVNIAEAARVLNEEPPLKPYIDLPRMATLARSMVRDSLDAFMTRDAERALTITRRDDEIDDIYRQLFRELLTYMIEQPKNVGRALHLLLVARNLERIGDHATNIAEDVVYYVDARDIRHPAAS